MKPLTFIIAFLAFVLLFSTVAPAQQQAQCADYITATAHLYENFGEEPVDMYVTDSGTAIVVMFDKEDESWTMLAVNAAGRACLAAQGNGRSQSFPDLSGEGS